jgi:hypothetical protein
MSSRSVMTEGRDRLRFDIPLYTITETAWIVDVPVSTLITWAQGYVRRFPSRSDVIGDPIVTYLVRGDPLAIDSVCRSDRGHGVGGVRRSGVPMQRIRPALAALETSLGVDHALASRSLYADGAELLYDFGESHSDSPEGHAALELVVLRSGQRVFTEAI